jgi:polyhydroxybutyrate depolymerase
MRRSELGSVLIFGALATLGCGGSDEESGGKGGAGTGGASGGSGGSTTGGAGGSPAGGAAGSATGGSAGSGGSGGAGGAPIPPPVADDCITDVTAKADHVFDCSGLKWNVSVPDPCVKAACGVIFDVHGFSMSGKMQNNNTDLVSLGAQNGFIVVQPNADPAPPLSGWNATADDPKIFDFIQRVMKAFHTDTKRLHFTGFSQGGWMTWRMICDHSDIIASAAPAAAGIPGGAGAPEEQCFSKGVAPAREMPMLYIHGTQDSIVQFSQATATRDAVIQVLAMSETATVSTDDKHLWKRWQNAKGTVFEFIQHDYVNTKPSIVPINGHCFPGSTDAGGEPGQAAPFGCDPPNAFVWGQKVVEFFLAHPMP